MNNNLRNGIIIIFISNIVNMGFKIFINFVQPAFLSVETYAMIQTFNLYVSYIGLLHCGYVDGMYLKYGGKKLEECDKTELNRSISTLRLLQLIISTGVVFIGFTSKNYILATVGCAVLPSNLAAYYRLLYQATGKFKMYGMVMNINTVFLFLYNLSLIFIFHVDNYQIFLICEVAVYFIMYLLLEVYYYKNFGSNTPCYFLLDKKELKTNILEGLPLTLGNLSSILFTSLDRWFVKILLTTDDFAYYSFAVSIETFMNVAISPVTITLYSYFCNHDREEEINKIKNVIMIFSVFIVSVAFPAKFILEHFIQKYIGSAEVLFVLFSAKILSIVIQSVYVNLYKAHKRQREYLLKLIGCIFVGSFFNAVGYFILKENISFAIATLFTVIVWFMISLKDFCIVKYTINDSIYIVASIIMINLFGKLFESIAGFAIYLGFEVFLSLLLQRDTFICIIKDVVLLMMSGFVKKKS